MTSYSNADWSKRCKEFKHKSLHPAPFLSSAVVTIPTLAAAPTVVTPVRSNSGGILATPGTTPASIAAAAAAAAAAAPAMTMPGAAKVASLMDVKVVPTGALAQVRGSAELVLL